MELMHIKMSLCRSEVAIVACFHIQDAQKPTQGGKGEVKRYNHSHSPAFSADFNFTFSQNNTN